MYECKPDYEVAKRRIDAFWECAVVDRALTYVIFQKPEAEQVPAPTPPDDIRERWFDADYRAEAALAQMRNNVWHADAMPVVRPTLGPVTAAAWFGVELAFDAKSSWAVHDPDAGPDTPLPDLRFDPENPYYRKSVEVVEALREAGDGVFITGIQEWLSPADILSALRGPETFCIDLLMRPDECRRVMASLSDQLFPIYETFYRMARDAGDPASNWLALVSDERYLVIQNDVSALLSPALFDEFLLPHTRRECETLDRTMYHLDGLQALKDLDRLLEIPELDAVQWGPPPQHWDWREWVDVYQRIQAAEKGFFLPVDAGDLDDLLASGIRPEGAWLIVSGVADRDHAAAVMRTVETWT